MCQELPILHRTPLFGLPGRYMQRRRPSESPCPLAQGITGWTRRDDRSTSRWSAPWTCGPLQRSRGPRGSSTRTSRQEGESPGLKSPPCRLSLSLCLLQLLTPGPLAAALDPRHKCRAPFPRSTQGYEYLMREILPACSKLAGRRVDKGFGIMDAKGLGLGTLTGEVRHVMRATTQLTQVGNPSDPDRTNSAFWGAGSASVCVLWLAGHGGLVGAASVPAGQLSRDQRSARHHQRTVHLQGERSSGHDLSRGTFSRLGVHWPYRASVDRRGAVEQRRRVDGARPESRFPACSLAICSIGEAQSAPSWRASVAYPPFGGHRGEACESPTLHWSPLPAAAACRPSLPSCDPC